MRSTMHKLFLGLATMLLLAACKKDESRVYFAGGTAPVLTSSASDSVSLSYANADKTALTLSWTNPAYQFNTGISSMDVSYLVEIDTTGSGFTNPNRQSISVSKDLGLEISVGQLNDYLLNQLQLAVGMEHHLEIRVTSTLANSSVPLASNVVQLTAIPYAIPPKVAPPASGELYLVGSATAGGWDNPVPVPSQQFTRMSETQYTLTVNLTGGQEYLFIPVNGDWSHKYACKAKASQAATGGDFGYDYSDNFPGPSADGTYTITVDFQRGKYTVVKQ